MNNFWQQRSAREQQLLLLAGIACIIYLLGYCVAAPLYAQIQQQKQQVRLKQQILTTMIEAKPRLTVAKFATTPESLPRLLTHTHPHFTVGHMQLQTITSTTAQLTFTDTPLTPLLNWLMTLHHDHGLQIQQASLKPGHAPGTATGQLILAYGASQN